MKFFFLLFTFLIANCNGFSQKIYSIKKSNKMHSADKAHYYYIEDFCTNKRLYFFSRGEAKKALPLLKRRIILFKEFFELNGLSNSSACLSKDLYEQLMSSSAIIITSLNFKSELKNNGGSNNFENKIIINCELKMHFNSAICIYVKYDEPIKNIRKDDVLAAPELCGYEI